MQYLNLTDFEYLYSLDLREYNNMMRGAMLRDIKSYQDMAIQSIFNARAANEKRVSVEKMFNAEKAKRQIMQGSTEAKKDFTRHEAAQKAMQGFKLT